VQEERFAVNSSIFSIFENLEFDFSNMINLLEVVVSFWRLICFMIKLTLYYQLSLWPQIRLTCLFFVTRTNINGTPPFHQDIFLSHHWNHSQIDKIKSLCH
jgi:hypothetical protein